MNKRFVQWVCEPASTFKLSSVEKELVFRRRRAVLYIYASAWIVFVIMAILMNRLFLLQTIVHLSYNLLIILSLIITSKSHPEVFNCLYNFWAMTYGTACIIADPNGSFSAYVSSLLCPLMVFTFTGSKIHTTIQSIGQFLLQKYFYMGLIQEKLFSLSDEAFLEALSYPMKTSLVAFSLSAYMINSDYLEAFRKVLVVESARDEIERQQLFLLSFTHELRNLANSIYGNLSLAILEEPTRKVKEYLDNSKICMEMLLQEINNILNSKRFDAGDISIQKKPTMIKDCLNRGWKICSELLKRKNLTGIMTISTLVPSQIVMDESRILEILLNLVGNSIKYTEKGFINISVDWELNKGSVNEDSFKPYPFDEDGVFEKNQAITRVGDGFNRYHLNRVSVVTPCRGASVRENKGVLKIAITDSGCGIREEDLNKIFKKFEQSGDEKMKMLGTGLGLFITKQICEKMGGEIRAFSKIGKGTSFVVCISSEEVLA